MLGFTRLIALICIICPAYLAGCVTRVPEPLHLDGILVDGILAHTDVIELKMRQSAKGLILLDDIKIGGKPFIFLLDTGATRSAVFENVVNALPDSKASTGQTLVHGMAHSGERGSLVVPLLELGTKKLPEQKLLILSERISTFGQGEAFDGLIGLDILSKYKIYVSPSEGVVRLIPSRLPVTYPVDWDKIELTKNPYQDDHYELRFMMIRLAGQLMPALLDTGAEFSVMNWHGAKYSQAKFIRRQLKKEWESQGAIGKFEPVAKVTFTQIRGGQKFWQDKDFLVMDFKSLDVLGVSDVPFAIVGMDLFAEGVVLIDFQRNFVAMGPNHVSDLEYQSNEDLNDAGPNNTAQN